MSYSYPFSVAYVAFSGLIGEFGLAPEKADLCCYS
jgi:hypothetical protein